MSAGYVSDLIGNPEISFSNDTAHILYLQDLGCCTDQWDSCSLSLVHQKLLSEIKKFFS